MGGGRRGARAQAVCGARATVALARRRVLSRRGLDSSLTVEEGDKAALSLSEDRRQHDGPQVHLRPRVRLKEELDRGVLLHSYRW